MAGIITYKFGLPQLNPDNLTVKEFLSRVAETLAKVPEDQQAPYLFKLADGVHAVAAEADRKRISDQMTLIEKLAALKKKLRADAEQIAALKKKLRADAEQIAELQQQLADKPRPPSKTLMTSVDDLQRNIALEKTRELLATTERQLQTVGLKLAATCSVNVLQQQQIEELTGSLKDAVHQLTAAQTENTQLKQMLTETLQRLGK